jgi:hypothetical protein
VGVIPEKPTRDFTRPLGMPSGLKGLLHTPNAIVSPTKADLCFSFFVCVFIFVLLRDSQNVSLGVFDKCLKVLILTP